MNVRMNIALFALVSAAGLAGAQPCASSQKILGSNPDVNDWFGQGIAMTFGGLNNEPLMAIGKPGEDAPVSGTDAGGFSIHHFNNGVWSMTYDSWNTTGQGGERLGAAMGMSDPYLIAGAPGYNNSQGRARIYRRPNGSSSWVHSTDVTILAANAPTGASFGSAVAISAIGDGWCVVGAPSHDWNLLDSGSAYFYTRDPATNQWNEGLHIWGGDYGGDAGAHRGAAVAMSQSTPWAAVGSPDETDPGQPAGHGKVTLVQRLANGTISAVVQQVRPPSPELGERFGKAVAIEGNWLVVGSPLEDVTLQESGFAYQATDSGSVYMYQLVNGSWTFFSKLRSPTPSAGSNFGAALSMTSTQFTVSEPGTKRVYVFANRASGWEYQCTLRDSDTVSTGSFGSSLAMYQSNIAVGDDLDDHSAVTNDGAVYTTAIQPISEFGDECTNPIPFSVGQYVGCTDLATPSIGTVTTCGNGGGGQGNDVWFSYTPLCTGTAYIDTFGSQFDTVLSVHCSCPTLGGTNMIACNDDYTFPAPNDRASRVSFDFTAGETYLIRVSGYNGASGAFTLRPSFFYPGVANDECNTAINVGVGSTHVSNCGATSSPNATGCVVPHSDTWYRFIADVDGPYFVNTCGSTFDTTLHVYAGSQASCPNAGTVPIACNDDVGPAACSPEYNTTSAVSFQGVAGQSYLIRIGEFYGFGEVGPGILNIVGPVHCNDIDFNNDGLFPDTDDIASFISVFSGGPCI